jgi:hypothetical protein
VAVHLVLLPETVTLGFVQNCLDESLPDIIIGPAAAENSLEIGFLVRKEAGPEFPF